MFDPNQRPSDGAGKGSPVYRAISYLGMLLGLAGAILLTPLIYDWTRAPLLSWLAKTYGPRFANILTYTFGWIEGGLILISTHLMFTCLVIWTFAAISARRFPGA
jgi:hypothetical protein